MLPLMLNWKIWFCALNGETFSSTTWSKLREAMLGISISTQSTKIWPDWVHQTLVLGQNQLVSTLADLSLFSPNTLAMFIWIPTLSLCILFAPNCKDLTKTSLPFKAMIVLKVIFFWFRSLDLLERRSSKPICLQISWIYQTLWWSSCPFAQQRRSWKHLYPRPKQGQSDTWWFCRWQNPCALPPQLAF